MSLPGERGRGGSSMLAPTPAAILAKYHPNSHNTLLSLLPEMHLLTRAIFIGIFCHLNRLLCYKLMNWIGLNRMDLWVG